MAGHLLKCNDTVYAIFSSWLNIRRLDFCTHSRVVWAVNKKLLGADTCCRDFCVHSIVFFSHLRRDVYFLDHLQIWFWSRSFQGNMPRKVPIISRWPRCKCHGRLRFCNFCCSKEMRGSMSYWGLERNFLGPGERPKRSLESPEVQSKLNEDLYHRTQRKVSNGVVLVAKTNSLECSSTPIFLCRHCAFHTTLLRLKLSGSM